MPERDGRTAGSAAGKRHGRVVGSGHIRDAVRAMRNEVERGMRLMTAKAVAVVSDVQANLLSRASAGLG
jgi:hypothetical protein